MRPSKLEPNALESALATLRGWDHAGDTIHKVYECTSFSAAIAFVVRIGFLAEAADHHPDIDVRYRRVAIGLTTHDAHGLTHLDIDLAREIDTAFGQ